MTQPPQHGDGVVTLPPIEGNDEMPKSSVMDEVVDLSANVANQLLTESVASAQVAQQNARAVSNIAMGALQGGMVTAHNELGVLESRANSGVLATPIAGPTNAQGS